MQWDDARKTAFKNCLNDCDLSDLEQKLTEMELSPSQEKLEDISSGLREVFITAAKNSGSLQERHKPRKSIKGKGVSKPWFDKDLRNARTQYLRAKNYGGYSSHDARQAAIAEKSKAYTTSRKAKEKEYFDSLTSTFKDTKNRNTKEIWKLLKNATGGVKGNLKMDLNKVA